MKILRTPVLTQEGVQQEIAAAIDLQVRARGHQPLSLFVTGGSSCPYWMPGLTENAARLKDAGFFLTDSFPRQAAVDEGRNDTNEESVLNAGLAKALGQQIVHPSQLHFPSYRLGDLSSVALQYGRTLRAFRGSATADVVFLSAGGGDYRKGGPKDPGHVAGLPHGQPALFGGQSEPFVVVNDMPKPPRQRISMTPDLISGASLVVLFILGEAKRGSLDNVLAGLSPEECPACLVCNHRNALVVTDLAE